MSTLYNVLVDLPTARPFGRSREGQETPELLTRCQCLDNPGATFGCCKTYLAAQGSRWAYDKVVRPASLRANDPPGTCCFIVCFLIEVAAAPKNTTRRVPSLRELDEELKRAIPSSADGLDMSLLTKTLVPPEMVSAHTCKHGALHRLVFVLA